MTSERSDDIIISQKPRAWVRRHRPFRHKKSWSAQERPCSSTGCHLRRPQSIPADADWSLDTTRPHPTVKAAHAHGHTRQAVKHRPILSYLERKVVAHAHWSPHRTIQRIFTLLRFYPIVLSTHCSTSGSLNSRRDLQAFDNLNYKLWRTR